ncbi:DEAD-box ATP-dependent RNA helicase CshA [Fimbriiglobus ruber]|uniref:DEAD-box ATP-dependent RNA helicase CshA n=1 Tax=Fimbriiglobus ruber TaxID=1908690 RepID=A0A225DPR5_9BACT|nr:DEAD/DEAH box helicase [Fimbriiglobus ruber]OWK43083.1 DEAD-box ATP-dependent RNA helicase CshA [Fimbriiglobus ruber]
MQSSSPPDTHSNENTFPAADPTAYAVEESLSFPETADATAPPAPRDRDGLPTTETPPEAAPIAYSDMKLIRPLQDAIDQAGYKFTTPVQAAVIPRAMRGKDVIGQAQTGTGKTAAFLIPFLNRWRPHKLKGPVGLVMCPTRELAVQVAEEAIKLAPSKRFRTVAVYGGAGMGRQLEQLAKGCDLVVGTPGGCSTT